MAERQESGIIGVWGGTVSVGRPAVESLAMIPRPFRIRGDRLRLLLDVCVALTSVDTSKREAPFIPNTRNPRRLRFDRIRDVPRERCGGRGDVECAVANLRGFPGSVAEL